MAIQGVKIHSRDGASVFVDGYVLQTRPHMCVHRTLWLTQGGAWEDEKLWTVSHLPSGTALYTAFHRRIDAIVFAQIVGAYVPTGGEFGVKPDPSALMEASRVIRDWLKEQGYKYPAKFEGVKVA